MHVLLSAKHALSSVELFFSILPCFHLFSGIRYVLGNLKEKLLGSDMGNLKQS